MKILDKLNNIKKLIGNTPLVEIGVQVGDKHLKIFAKCEMYNLTGSIKDRCVYNILYNNALLGNIKNNSVLLEATSGNTGISLACLGGYLGNKVVIVMPSTVSSERAELIKQYGGEVVFSKDNMLSTLNKVAKKYNNVFLLNQFTQKLNVLAHYNTTAPEMLNCLNAHDLKLQAFACGVGTGGSFEGISSYLKEKADIKCFALQSSKINLLNGNEGGLHLLQGLASEFTPPLFNKHNANEVLAVDDMDSVYVAQSLCSRLGIGVGISSGANVLGCVLACLKYGLNNIATVLPDDNKKYLSTVLSQKVLPSKFAKSIKFTDLRVL